ATLVMPMLAASTVTLALAWPDPSLEVVTNAVLSTGESAGVAEVVGLVMCTCTESPAAMVPMGQVRAPEAIEQAGAVVPPASMDQEVPASVGRVSVRATPLATPGPALETVTVNPIGSPAETVAESAVLVMAMAAPSTVTLALACPEPSLEVLTVAVLSTGESAGVAEVVGLVRCTVRTAP